MVRERVVSRVGPLLHAYPGPGRAWRGRQPDCGSRVGCGRGATVQRCGASPGRFAVRRFGAKDIVLYWDRDAFNTLHQNVLRSLCVLSCPDADAQANAGDGSAERPLDFDQARAYIDGAWRRRTGLPSWRETVFACAFVPACAACRTQVRVTTVYCLRRISFATAGEGCASPTPSLWCGVTLVRDRVARRVVGLLLACPGPGRAWRGRRVLLGSHAGCAWGNLARRHGASPGRFASTRMRDKMTNRLVQGQGCVHFTRAC